MERQGRQRITMAFLALNDAGLTGWQGLARRDRHATPVSASQTPALFIFDMG
jgi:hypothetical protein